MVNLVKESFKVDVHYILIAIIDVFQGLCYRLMDVLLWAEAVAVLFERKFVFGHQHLAYRLLEPSVYYCWDSKQSGLSVTLGYFDPFDRFGYITVVEDGGGNPIPVAFQKGKQLGDVHAVHPCRTFVPHYLSVCFVEVLTVEYFFYHNLIC